MKLALYLLLLARLAAADAVVKPGAKVTFYATADGTPAPTFQWRKDGQDIPGATSATYVIATFGPAHAGRYTARASNAAGSAESGHEGIYLPGQLAPKNPKIEAKKK